MYLKVSRSIVPLTVATLLLSSCGLMKSYDIAKLSVEQFHDRLNAQNCAGIYVDTDTEFKKVVIEKNFIQFCKQIRQKLGEVRKTTQVRWNVSANPSETIAILNYETEFSLGSASEQFVWVINGDKAILRQYEIENVLFAQ